jgi:glycosyltransferase involved in cell wall biosynthesis
VNNQNDLRFELVLPCYNESRSIKRLIDRAIAAASAAGFSENNFKLVLVDNGSNDEDDDNE